MCCLWLGLVAKRYPNRREEDMSKREYETEGVASIEREARIKEPPMYKVMLLNDDYTTMEFVIVVLESLFRKTREEAQQIMLAVHAHGSGLAGVYTKEVAETKVETVHAMARQNEFPLRCKIEPDS